MPKGHGTKLEAESVIKGHDHSLCNDPNHTEDDGAETEHKGLHIIIDTENDPNHDIVKIVVTGTTTLVGNVTVK